jgi:Fuc2NAc and GlcNAc transferase
MASSVAAVLLIVFTCAVLVTRWMRRVALSRGLLDVPNARSSHEIPTPRGGGVAIVAAAMLGFVLLAVAHRIDRDLLIALLGGGVLVACVGFVDDHRPLSPGVRLLMHGCAAVWALAWLGGLPVLRVGDQLMHPGVYGYVLGALAIVWTLNLFNFMDGIDGIAASEAICVGVGAALVAAVAGSSTGAVAGGLVLAAACGGFLCFNWPPARIFMGDVGSGFVGFIIAVLALAANRNGPSAVWQWLLLGALFFVDATVTLARRVARGERAQDAHRSHAYQWLSRRWNSHRRVTLLTIGLNAVCLVPCALLAAIHPELAACIAALILVFLGVGAVCAGAGRPERPL